jgi:glycosyltransferase involved in cell wall biosynthesis
MPEGIVWEVIVVDNNSTDDTSRVVKDFQQSFPRRFRYIFEPKPGKSNALNRAIRESDADVMAFMDDDVQVDADWLRLLTGVLGNQQYAGCGGRILPASGFSLPSWLNNSRHYALAPIAMFDLGPDSCELKEPPFGTNMAFRRDVFSRYGDFRLDLGPRPGSEIRSEDTEFGMRVLQGGERLWYEPSAVVHHLVPIHRVKQDYFLRWWYAKGRGDVRERIFQDEMRLTFSGVPLVLLRRLMVWSVRWLCSIGPGPRYECKAKVWWLAGEIRESFELHRTGRTRNLAHPQETQ